MDFLNINGNIDDYEKFDGKESNGFIRKESDGIIRLDKLELDN